MIAQTKKTNVVSAGFTAADSLSGGCSGSRRAETKAREQGTSHRERATARRDLDRAAAREGRSPDERRRAHAADVAQRHRQLGYSAGGLEQTEEGKATALHRKQAETNARRPAVRGPRHRERLVVELTDVDHSAIADRSVSRSTCIRRTAHPSRPGAEDRPTVAISTAMLAMRQDQRCCANSGYSFACCWEDGISSPPASWCGSRRNRDQRAPSYRRVNPRHPGAPGSKLRQQVRDITISQRAVSRQATRSSNLSADRVRRGRGATTRERVEDASRTRAQCTRPAASARRSKTLSISRANTTAGQNETPDERTEIRTTAPLDIDAAAPRQSSAVNETPSQRSRYHSTRSTARLRRVHHRDASPATTTPTRAVTTTRTHPSHLDQLPERTDDRAE